MSHQIDPQFAARVASYEQNRKRGMLFVSDGVPAGQLQNPAGQAWRGKRFRNKVLRRFVMVVAIVILLKALIYHVALDTGLANRATVLMGSQSWSKKAVAVLLYPDPVSVELNQYIRLARFYLELTVREIVRS